MRVSGVDGLRGLATVMVAVGHAWFLGGMAHLDEGGPLPSLIAATWIGVDLFFVLSALVLLAPYAAGKPFGRARDFYRRRVARLVPLYLVALVLAMILAAWLQPATPVPPSPSGWSLLGAHLLFVQNAFYAGAEHGVGFGTNSVVWTLGVEAAFYAVLPLIAAWWVRHPFLGLALGLGIARTWSGLVHAAPLTAQQQLLLQLPSYAAHFAVGLTLAVVLFHPRYAGAVEVVRPLAGPLKVLGAGWLLAFMVGIGGRGLAGDGQPLEHVLGTLPVLPGLALLVAGAALAPSRLLDGRVARFLADTSYPVYLLHLMAIEVAVQLGIHGPGENVPFVVLLAGPVAATFAVAWWVHHSFEQPARRWINGYRPSRALEVSLA